MSSSNPISEPAEQAGNSVSVGSQLRLAREQAGLGVEELARRLCMTSDKLEALEQNDFDRLAGATYVRGYIRNACKELGLDSAPVLDAFAQQVPTQAAAHVPEMPRGAVMARGSQPEGGSPFGPTALVLAMVAAGGYWWFGLQGGTTAPAVDSGMIEATSEQSFTAEASAAPAEVIEPAFDTFTASAAPEPAVDEVEQGLSEVDDRPQPDAEVEVAEAAPAEVLGAFDESPTAEPEVTAESVTSDEPVVPAAAEEPAIAVDTAVPGQALSLTFSEESWVEVVDATGNKLLAKLQPAGSTIELTGEAPFSLMLGNAAATTVSYAGEVVDSAPLGNRRTRKLTVGG